MFVLNKVKDSLDITQLLSSDTFKQLELTLYWNQFNSILEVRSIIS